jgi:hypothetical protein
MVTNAAFSSCMFRSLAFVNSRNVAQRRFLASHLKIRTPSAVAGKYPFGNEGDPSDVKTRLKERAEARMEEIVARV